MLQNRKRVIIIGWKKDINFSFDQLKCQSRVEYKVGNIFNDLPKLEVTGKAKDKYYEYAEGINDYLSFARIRNGLDVLTQHIARPHTEQDKEIYRIAVRKWKRSKERLDYNDLPERLKTHKTGILSSTDSRLWLMMCHAHKQLLSILLKTVIITFILI